MQPFFNQQGMGETQKIYDRYNFIFKKLEGKGCDPVSTLPPSVKLSLTSKSWRKTSFYIELQDYVNQLPI